MMHSYFDLPDAPYQLGGNKPIHTQILWDALTRSPDPPEKEDLTTLPDRHGPWSIEKEEDGFFWKPIAQPTAKQKLRFHIKPWRTRRKTPDAIRLALIGESAAASWGFKGNYCLSSLLESSLARLINKVVEVVDLSLINAVWDHDCLPAVHAAMSLDPDIFVVFCGNNEARWLLPRLQFSDIEHSHVPSGFAARWSFTQKDTQERLDAIGQAYEQGLSRSLMRTITLIREFDKELIFVVPPFNLRDWILPERLPHHLKKTAMKSWLHLMESGAKHESIDDLNSAENNYREAINIDGAMCQRSLQALGCLLDRCGEHSKANKLLMDSVGAGLGPYISAVPSLTGRGRLKLLDVLKTFNVPIIDLQAIFRDDSAGRPPGSEYLIDYCHLSEKGHTLLVRELCRTLLRFTRLRHLVDSSASQIQIDTPSAHESSLAALMAGLHNFQNGQSEELIRYWLTHSAKHEAGQRILDFLGSTVCSSFRERITIAKLEKEGLIDAFLNERFLTFGLKFIYHERFDTDLWKVINDIQKQADWKLQTNGALNARKYNLKSLFHLDRRQGFSLSTRQMSRHEWESIGQDFLVDRCKSWLEFVLDNQETHKVKSLEIVASPPWKNAENQAIISCNGCNLGQVKLKKPQTHYQLNFPEGILKCGLNKLVFQFEELFCPQEIDSIDELQSYWMINGPYPIAAVIHDLRLQST